VPLHKWFQAVLLTAGPRRISANRLHLLLDITYKTALAMVRRLGRTIDAGGAAADRPPIVAPPPARSRGLSEAVDDAPIPRIRRDRPPARLPRGRGRIRPHPHPDRGTRDRASRAAGGSSTGTGCARA
jgi:hypothetical protein